MRMLRLGPAGVLLSIGGAVSLTSLSLRSSWFSLNSSRSNAALDSLLPSVLNPEDEQPTSRMEAATSQLSCEGRPIAMLSLDFSRCVRLAVDQPFAPIHRGSFRLKLVAAMTR